MRIKSRAHVRRGDSATAERDDPAARCEHVGHDLRFEFPELLGTIGDEDVGNGPPGSADDLVIGIDEVDPEPVGEQPTDGRFPRTHEPDEHSGRFTRRCHARCRRCVHDRAPRCATRLRYPARLSEVSVAESPPNFSRAACATTSATIDSATTPAAGTATTSER